MIGETINRGEPFDPQGIVASPINGLAFGVHIIMGKRFLPAQI